LDPVVKHNLSSYSCFTLNPIWNTDILGDDDLKFNNKGEYISGKERSKVHGFLFGSKGFIVDESGKTTSTFKFNDSKDSQKKKWEEGTQVFYKVNLKFGDEMEEEVQARIANAPKEPIARLKWVAIESKPKKEGRPMIDYYTNPTSNLNAGEINVVNGKGYNSMDGGNYLWGKSLAMLKIPYPLARAGSLANGFWNGRKQNSLTPNNGIFRITWYGDDRADQRAIRDGYSK